jgi:hypothetical protein
MPASVRSDDERKRLGIYYTPPQLAQTLVSTAITSPHDTVLEPSFGGCNFLKASHDRLLALGSKDPLRQICGADIDKHALDSIGRTFGMIDVQKRFLLQDFLSTTPEDFCIPKFDVIVGNPPYISHHAMSAEQKTTAWMLASISTWNLRRTASLWAYFILHSLTFCKPGGRIAFVLPLASLLSNYSVAVRAALESSFDDISFTDAGDRLFRDQGTSERSVLLVGKGFGAAKRTSTSEAESFILSHANERWAAQRTKITADTRQVFDTLASKAVALGACADLRIGAVTGANKVFVITSEAANQAKLNKYVLPALAKVPRAHGLEYTVEDHERAAAAGDKCYLLLLPSKPQARQTLAVQKHLSSLSLDAITANRTFQKRRLWCVIEDADPPDAFLSYMHHDSPTLLINELGAVCTNNIHRIWWKTSLTPHQQMLVTISFLTTFTQLSAELEGRTYGGGVLKHELGEARNIRVLLPSSVTVDELRAAHTAINDHLRHGRRDSARAVADALLLSHALRRQRLSAALHAVRKDRTARG